MDFKLVLLCSLLVFASVVGQKEKDSKKDTADKLNGTGPGKKVKKNETNQVEGKIVGGTAVAINQVPYQLSLIVDRKHACGASIIHSRYALTAAHCTHGISARRMQVRAGSNTINAGGQTVQVRQVFQHELYNPARTDVDISILELSQPINNQVSRVAVLGGSEPAAGATGLISGWGTTREDGNPSTNLQYVTVPIVDRGVCASKYQKFNAITPHMICAGYLNGQKDACQGDSGGPLLVNGKQVGIVSWGIGCARANTPGVYTNVARLIPWILQRVPEAIVM